MAATQPPTLMAGVALMAGGAHNLVVVSREEQHAAAHAHQAHGAHAPEVRPGRSGSGATGTDADSVTVSVGASTVAQRRVSCVAATPRRALFDSTHPSVRAAYVPADKLAALPKRAVREFYEQQNEFIVFMRETDADLKGRHGHDEDAEAGCSDSGGAGPLPAVPEGSDENASQVSPTSLAQPPPAADDATADAGGDIPAVATAAERAAGRARTARLVALAINLSFACNILLMGIKLFAAITSASMAVIASLVDSLLDLVSGSIIWVAAWLASRKSADHPVGKTRYEPLGIICFACVMAMAAVLLSSEAAQQIAAGTPSSAGTTTLICLGVIVAIKGALWLFCRTLAEDSSSVAALAQDHFNDVITNSATLLAVGLAMEFPVVWWLDPGLCIALALFILVNWVGAAREQIGLLASQAATPGQVARLTYVALSHQRDKVLAVDTVLGYTLGNKLQVELDIVLPRDMPLHEAHDIGESLQRRIERLDFVERAFTHLDTEWAHSRDTEHVNPYDSD